MTDTQPTPSGGNLSSLSRLVGAVILLVQAAAQLLEMPTNLTLIGVALFLLTGRESLDFLRILLGRDRGTGSGPP